MVQMIQNIPQAGIFQQTDWTRVKQAVDIVIDEITQERWEERKSRDEHMSADVYSMVEHGVALRSLAIDQSNWFWWGGTWLEKILPWAKQLRNKMNECDLPISTITYHNHSFSVLGHRDSNYLGEYPDLPHTNVNYIISSKTPDVSYTWCRDDNGQEMRYYSHPGGLWLINASNMHGIETQTFREAIIIKFRLPYERLSTFFSNNPNFFDADQPYFQS